LTVSRNRLYFTYQQRGDGMYIYIKSEQGVTYAVWTVGHYDPKDDNFIPESDHSTPQQAAERVRYLNGGVECQTVHRQLR